ncbi:sialate O-acetylesterase [Niabella soli]|uniref:Sialate O-acetylesterase domain-containing protein n=1 Tax=Niabella soli DSM 19437 TaxID=929713 RepID=W0EZ39_9BACT|nr:sialate O-acetylesterase [Niabella soli]AHF16037.1 hypothetical protein NIASO_14500 [Niabella soli DSM 19437]
MKKLSLVILSVLVLSAAASAQKALFLVAGQSNGVGQGDASLSVKNTTAPLYEYVFTGNTFCLLADPVGQEELHLQQAHTGSAWPSFAAAYHKLTKDTVIIIAAARGGSSCNYKAELPSMGTWDTVGTLPLFDSALLKTKAAIRLAKCPLNGIIWSQGERDANAINAGRLTPEEYAQTLQLLIGRFRKALGAVPFYIIQTGYYRNHPKKGFDAVRRAQVQLCNTKQQVYMVYDQTGTFEQKGWMKDDIHYNQTALNHIGVIAAQKIAAQKK